MKKNHKKIKFLSEDLNIAYLTPSPAARELPTWFKGIDPVRENQLTIKKCIPVLDAMTTGYIFKTSADVMFDEGLNRFIDNGVSPVVSHHEHFQIEGFDLGNQLIPDAYKWVNRFQVFTPKGYSIMFTHPVNRFDLPFQTLSGFVDTDEYPLSVQFPFFMKKGFSGLIPAGTPIAQAILVKRDDWEVDSKVQTESYVYPDFWKWHLPPLGKYKREFWKRKRYN